jgi:spermidine synthase
VRPWEGIACTTAPDGTPIELRRRGHEYLILAGGYELMSSEDESSSRALAELNCAQLQRSKAARVLIGGLGMGYTLRAALDVLGPGARVEVAELVPAVVEWNCGALGRLAGHPLGDPRTQLRLDDVHSRISAGRSTYDAILLDVDNGPAALAHPTNAALYSRRGLAEAWAALKPAGSLGVWSFANDRRFTDRLEQQGFAVQLHKVPGSRKGRGRYHYVWAARRDRRKG